MPSGVELVCETDVELQWLKSALPLQMSFDLNRVILKTELIFRDSSRCCVKNPREEHQRSGLLRRLLEDGLRGFRGQALDLQPEVGHQLERAEPIFLQRSTVTELTENWCMNSNKEAFIFNCLASACPKRRVQGTRYLMNPVLRCLPSLSATKTLPDGPKMYVNGIVRPGHNAWHRWMSEDESTVESIR